MTKNLKVKSSVKISLMTLFAFAGTAAFAEAAKMIETDGRTATSVTENGGVWNVSTATARGKNAFNSFSRFDVDSGTTVNLYLPTGTSNLINLVRDKKTSIDGILNSFKDGALGAGNVFFLNPNGIAVGAGAVVNTGSLLLMTPTKEFMDELIAADGAISDAKTAAVLAGDVPISADGLISVKARLDKVRAFAAYGSEVSVAGTLAPAAGAMVNLRDDGGADALRGAGVFLSASKAIRVEKSGAIDAASAGKNFVARGEGDYTQEAGTRVSAQEIDIDVGGNAKLAGDSDARAALSAAGTLSAKSGGDASLAYADVSAAGASLKIASGGNVALDQKSKISGANADAAVSAGGNFTLTGESVVEAKTLVVSADGAIVLGSTFSGSDKVRISAEKILLSAGDEFRADTGSRVEATAGTLAVAAGGDVTLLLAELSATGGDLAVFAKGSVSADKCALGWVSELFTGFRGTRLSGRNVTIQANGDVDLNAMALSVAVLDKILPPTALEQVEFKPTITADAATGVVSIYSDGSLKNAAVITAHETRLSAAADLDWAGEILDGAATITGKHIRVETDNISDVTISYKADKTFTLAEGVTIRARTGDVFVCAQEITLEKNSKIFADAGEILLLANASSNVIFTALPEAKVEIGDGAVVQARGNVNVFALAFSDRSLTGTTEAFSGIEEKLSGRGGAVWYETIWPSIGEVFNTVTNSSLFPTDSQTFRDVLPFSYVNATAKVVVGRNARVESTHGNATLLARAESRSHAMMTTPGGAISLAVARGESLVDVREGATVSGESVAILSQMKTDCASAASAVYNKELFGQWAGALKYDVSLALGVQSTDCDVSIAKGATVRSTALTDVSALALDADFRAFVEGAGFAVPAAEALDMKIAATTDKSFSVAAEATSLDNGAISVAGAIGVSTVNNSVKINGNVVSAGNMAISSSISGSEDMGASTGVGGTLGWQPAMISEALHGAISGIFSKASRNVANAAQGNANSYMDGAKNQTVDFAFSGAFSVGVVDNVSEIVVGEQIVPAGTSAPGVAAQLSGGNIAISSSVSANAKSGVSADIESTEYNDKATDPYYNDKENGLALGVNVLVASDEADATVKDGAKIDATKSFVLNSVSKMPFWKAAFFTGESLSYGGLVDMLHKYVDGVAKKVGSAALKKAIKGGEMKIKAGMFLPSSYMGFVASSSNSSSASTQKTDGGTESGLGGVGVAGNVQVKVRGNTAHATIEDGALINQGGGTAGTVSVTAKGVQDSVDSMVQDSVEAKNGGGLGVMIDVFNSDVRAEVGAAKIDAKNLKIAADNRQRYVSIVCAGNIVSGYPSMPASGRQIIAEGSYSQLSADAKVYAGLSGAATVNVSGSTKISAKNSSKVVNVSGEFSTAEKAAIGIGVAITDAASDVRAYVGEIFDADAENVPASSLAAGTLSLGDASVTAENTGWHFAVGAAGTVTKNSAAGNGVAANAPANPGNGGVAAAQNGNAAGAAQGVAAVNNGGAAQGQAAGGANWGVGISGEIGYNRESLTTLAYVLGSGKLASNVTLRSLDVSAKEEMDIYGGVGSLAANTTSASTSVTVAGAAGMNFIRNDLRAFVQDVALVQKLRSDGAYGDVSVSAVNANRVVAVAASAGISVNSGSDASTFNVAGAVGVNGIEEKRLEAYVKNATLRAEDSGAAGTLSLSAKNAATIYAGAGTLGLTTGSGVGVAIGVNIVGGDAVARVENSELVLSGAASIVAENVSEIQSVAAGVGISGGSVGVEGSIAVNSISSAARALLKDSALEAGTLSMGSLNRETIRFYGGEIFFAGAESKLGVGVSVVVDTMKSTAETTVEGANVAAAKTELAADSETDTAIYLVSGGLAFGGSAIDVNVAVATVDAHANVLVDRSLVDGLLSGKATETMLGGIYGGVVAVSLGESGVGIGVYASVFSGKHDVGAVVKNSTVLGAVNLEATTDDLFGAIVVTAGGSVSVGGAGNIAVYRISGTTRAALEDSTVNAGTAGDVSLNADDKTVVGEESGGRTVALGAGAAGISAGALAASIGVSNINNTTAAEALRCDVTARDLKITAHADHRVASYLISASIGQHFAGAASVGVGTITSDTRALFDGGDGARRNLALAGDLAIDAKTEQAFYQGNGAAAVNFNYGAAVTAAVDVLSSYGETRAELCGNADVSVGGDVAVKADTTRDFYAVTVGAAGGFVTLQAALNFITVGSGMADDVRKAFAGAQEESGEALSRIGENLAELSSQTGTAGTFARIGAGVKIADARDVRVVAHDFIDAFSTTGDVNASLAGMGANVALADLSTSTRALFAADSADLRGNLSLDAETEVARNKIKAFRGSLQLGGNTATVAKVSAEDTLTEAAVLGNVSTLKADSVSVRANDKFGLAAEGYGIAVSGGDVSAVVSQVSKGGRVVASSYAQSAELSGNLDVVASDDADFLVYALTGAGTIGGIQGTAANSYLENTLLATLAGSTTAGGKISVSTDAREKIRSQVDGWNFGGLAVGASLAEAVNTMRGAVVVSGTQTAAEISALAKISLAEVRADAFAAGGALVSGQGAGATAKLAGTLSTEALSGARLSAGRISLGVRGDSYVRAHGTANHGGVVAAGGVDATAEIDLKRRLSVGNADGSATLRADGGEVNFAVAGTDVARALSELGSGGALDTQGVFSTAHVASDATIALVKANVSAAKISASAENAVDQRAQLDASHGGAAAFGGVRSYATTKGAATITASGSTLRAHDFDFATNAAFRNGPGDDSYGADSAFGGLISGEGDSLKWNGVFESYVSFDEATKLLGDSATDAGTLSVKATSDVRVREALRSVAKFSLLGGSGATLEMRSEQHDDVRLRGLISFAGDVKAQAASKSDLQARTLSSCDAGFAGYVEGKARIYASADNRVAVSGKIAAKSVDLQAKNLGASVHGSAYVWNYNVIPTWYSDGIGDFRLNDSVAVLGGAEILTAGGGVNIAVEDGAVDAYGRYWNKTFYQKEHQAKSGVVAGAHTFAFVQIDGNVTVDNSLARTGVVIDADGKIFVTRAAFDDAGNVSRVESEDVSGEYVAAGTADLYAAYSAKIAEYEAAKAEYVAAKKSSQTPGAPAEVSDSVTRYYDEQIAAVRASMAEQGIDAEHRTAEAFCVRPGLEFSGTHGVKIVTPEYRAAFSPDPTPSGRIRIVGSGGFSVENRSDKNLFVAGLSVSDAQPGLTSVGAPFRGDVQADAAVTEISIVARKPASGRATAISLGGEIVNTYGSVLVRNESGGAVETSATILADSVTIDAGRGNFYLNVPSYYDGSGRFSAYAFGNFAYDQATGGFSQGGAELRANNVTLIADVIDVNGDIVAGTERYTLVVPETLALHGAASVEEARASYAAGGEERYRITNATGNVEAWYNARLDAVEVEEIDARGGTIELVGKVVSTGTGKLTPLGSGGVVSATKLVAEDKRATISVFDGYARISVDNKSAYGLYLNELGTGSDVEGKLIIRDRVVGYDSAGKPALLPGDVTVFSRLNSVVTKMVNGVAQTDDVSTFTPNTGADFGGFGGVLAFDTMLGGQYYMSSGDWLAAFTYKNVNPNVPVNVAFVGAATGSVSVTSRGAGIRVAGTLGGDGNVEVSLSSTSGSIESLGESALLRGKNIGVSASAGDVNVFVNQTPGGRLDAYGNAVSIAAPASGVAYGSVVAYGDLSIDARGDVARSSDGGALAMRRDGAAISLVSREGGVSALVDGGYGTYRLSVQAYGDVSVSGMSAPGAWEPDPYVSFLVDSVKSETGDVSFGSVYGVYDGNDESVSAWEADEEALSAWRALGLTRLDETQLAEAEADYETARTGEYFLYWTAHENGRKVEGAAIAFSPEMRIALRERGYDDAAIDALEKTDLDTQFDALYGGGGFDKDFAYSASDAERAELRRGAGCTEAQLKTMLVGVSKTDETVNTRFDWEAPNVVGKNVSISAKKIGKVAKERVEIDLRDPEILTDEQRKILASASREDMEYRFDDAGNLLSVSVRIAEDLNVEASGVLDASASYDLRIGSESDITVGNVGSYAYGGVVQLKTSGSILAANADSKIVGGIGSVSLEAAYGQIGSAETPLTVEFEEYRFTDALFGARTAGDVFVNIAGSREVVGIDYVLGGNVRIAAEGKTLANYRTDGTTNVRATALEIRAGQLGAADADLNIHMRAGTEGEANGVKIFTEDDVFIDNRSAKLVVDTISSAHGNVTISAGDVVGGNGSDPSISAETITIRATGDVGELRADRDVPGMEIDVRGVLNATGRNVYVGAVGDGPLTLGTVAALGTACLYSENGDVVLAGADASVSAGGLLIVDSDKGGIGRADNYFRFAAGETDFYAGGGDIFLATQDNYVSSATALKGSIAIRSDGMLVAENLYAKNDLRLDARGLVELENAIAETGDVRVVSSGDYARLANVRAGRDLAVVGYGAIDLDGFGFGRNVALVYMGTDSNVVWVVNGETIDLSTLDLGDDIYEEWERRTRRRAIDSVPAPAADLLGAPRVNRDPAAASAPPASPLALD